MTDEQIKAADNEKLLREYKDGMRHCFNKMFGRNARLEQNAIATELLARGVTHMPNIFGPIEIVNRW